MSLYQKYFVEKIDGESDPDAKYIVLRYDASSKDLNARKALMFYCQLSQNPDGSFAESFFQDLWDAVNAEASQPKEQGGTQ